jgi:hypothetical protein
MRHTRMLGWGGALVLLLAVVPWAQAGWAGAIPTCFHRCCPSGSRQVTRFYSSFYRDPCTGQAGIVVQRVTACRPKRYGPIRRFLRRLFGKSDCCDPCCAVAVPACPPTPPPPAAVIQPPPMEPPAGGVAPPSITPPPVPPPGEGARLRFQRSPGGTPPRLTPTKPPRPIPFDRLASRPGNQGTLHGQVAPGAEVLFVSAGPDGDRRSFRADGSGRFRANVPEGGWLIYVREVGRRATFAGRAEVRAGTMSEVTLSGR